MKRIELGKEVRDIISGCTGIACSHIEYLNGCEQIGIRPRVGADGKFPDAFYADVDNVEVIGDGVAIARTTVGGPSAQISGSYPA